jgi:hypothetical protein
LRNEIKGFPVRRRASATLQARQESTRLQSRIKGFSAYPASLLQAAFIQG